MSNREKNFLVADLPELAIADTDRVTNEKRGAPAVQPARLAPIRSEKVRDIPGFTFLGVIVNCRCPG